MCRLFRNFLLPAFKSGYLHVLTGLLLLSANTQIYSQTSYSHRGQLSSLVQYSENTNSDVWLLRYIPEFSLNQPVGNNALDIELAFNMFTRTKFDSLNRIDENAEVDLYRFWLRYSASQFEARIGLQKISFGSSTLLRPLRWFDRVDPRDPLQITDGVYGALLRYYFLNNANIWLWGLIGNDEPKGWDIFFSKKNTPEVGGRIQYPLLQFGELGASYHYRKIDLEKTLGPTINQLEVNESEHKFGADLRLDYIIGSWVEAAWIRQDFVLLPIQRQQFVTIGADYTLPVSNGIQVIGEHMWISYGMEFFEHDDTIPLSAMLANYSYGLLDQFSLILTQEWKNNTTSRFIRWGRTYDRWQFFVNAFWNDDPNQQGVNILLGGGINAINPLSGRGAQLLITLNY